MKELSIIVCAKQIPDPEAPLSDVSVDTDKKEVIVDAPQSSTPLMKMPWRSPFSYRKRWAGRSPS